ncbi:Nucleolar protein 58 [Recurvomyces mirabilis]|uniref:Nucleolar protein 58 n=1 Tax=Recurvomyces mirabilis TaxID=574656 RepID=A0AAE0TN88_9PEZI|nr:Nucleolar protein 58 [Recurvomyces mirabilis]KAK5153094.1 Nucleolar protein 58 [Recurvomyces mirabilis]
MTLFILTETSAGYALLKAKDKKLLKRDDLAKEAETAEGVCSLLKLKQFRKFESAAAALEEASALTDGKVTPMLSNMLSELKDEKKVSLAVADPKLGNSITKIPGLDISPVSDSTTADLYRAIREHLPSLIPGLLPEEIGTMSLGLSHSLSRHKLKFSPDKVDTMIIQAIALLDDLDKELNTYAMRVKEWYGWHFPEMAKIINDNLAFSRVILSMGMRTNAATTDLSDILPEEIEGAVKAAAEVSMGTEITDVDLDCIKELAEQVVGFTEYRQQLSSYLTARMQAIAPNLTALVGELVGARLIAHSGSLMNLAKSPASTIQILGAEKALFRALKTKHDTPKYGLIYHASLIGQASGKNKGKIARMLATKATLGLRVDALSDWGQAGEGEKEEPTEEEKSEVGVQGRAMLERRLRGMEGKPLKASGVAIGPGGKQQPQTPKWEIKEARKYNADADGVAADATPAAALTNGDSAKPSKKRKLVEEVDAPSSKTLKASSSTPVKVGAEEEDDSDDDEDESMEDEEDSRLITKTNLNGTATRKEREAAAPPNEAKTAPDDKAARKAEKKKLKAEKAERKAERAEKRAKKEGKVNGDVSKEGKKRKVDAGGEEEPAKKKTKKSKASS